MTTEEKARELAIKSTRDIDDRGNEVYNALVEAALQEMAEWKEQQTIEKAIKWFDEHFDVNTYEEIGGRKAAEILTYDFKSIDNMLDTFKKDMEE